MFGGQNIRGWAILVTSWIFSWLLLAPQVKVGKVASFGKLCVVRAPTTNILSPRITSYICTRYCRFLIIHGKQYREKNQLGLGSRVGMHSSNLLKQDTNKNSSHLNRMCRSARHQYNSYIHSQQVQKTVFTFAAAAVSEIDAALVS